jgi:hypothetical protein
LPSAVGKRSVGSIKVEDHNHRQHSRGLGVHRTEAAFIAPPVSQGIAFYER